MPSRLEISIPTASFDGLYHGRYPHGDAPQGAVLAGAAIDAVSASGGLAATGGGGLSIVGGNVQTLATGTVGTPYSASFSITGAVGAVTVSKTLDVTTAKWPKVTVAGGTGSIAGAPVAVEPGQSIQVTVTDSATPTPNSVIATFTIPSVSRPGFVPNITSLRTLSTGGTNTAAYSALAVGSMVAGTNFFDPVTGVLHTKLSDATHPGSSANWCNEYSTMGLQISQAWGASLNKYTIFIMSAPSVSPYLLDYTIGGTCSNYRPAPAGEGDVCFSRLPGEAQILYYTTSTKLNRYDTAANALANTGGFPYTWPTIGGSGGNWLQFNRKHTWATSLNAPFGGAVNNFTAIKIGAGNGVADGHVQNAATGVNSNEGYCGYEDLAFIEGTGNSDYVWDLNGNLLHNTTYSASFSTQFHSPTMPGYWPWCDTNQGGGVEPYHQIDESGTFSTPHQGSYYYGQMHTSGHWTQSAAAAAQYGLLSTWQKGNPSVNTPAMDQNMVFVDYKSGGTFVLGGHYSFGTNPDYRAQPHATISDDGLLVLYSSDMFNAGGRVDAFLIEVPKH